MAHKLEELVKLASTDPDKRQEFYRKLLDSHLFVAVSPNPEVKGEISGFLKNEALPIEYWERPDGSPVFPVFSSKKLLEAVIDSEKNSLKLPARTIFDLTKGAYLVLNPGSEYPKELHPGEIDALLNGELFESE